MKLTTPRIESARLILRQIQLSDLDHYHTRLTSDPEVFRYLLGQCHNDKDRTAAKIQQICAGYDAMDRCHWGIALKKDDSLIGTIALQRFESSDNSCSFAYMLGREFWGQGYGTEAVTAVFDYAFRILNIQAIHADHFAENPASGAVMRKVGMQYVTTIPGKYEKLGKQYDAVEYRITKEMWDHTPK